MLAAAAAARSSSPCLALSLRYISPQVQQSIAKRAKLTIAPWDGYLKYYNLGTKARHALVSSVCTDGACIALSACRDVSICAFSGWLPCAADHGDNSLALCRFAMPSVLFS